jgi:hypothetical protein
MAADPAELGAAREREAAALEAWRRARWSDTPDPIGTALAAANATLRRAEEAREAVETGCPRCGYLFARWREECRISELGGQRERAITAAAEAEITKANEIIDELLDHQRRLAEASALAPDWHGPVATPKRASAPNRVKHKAPRRAVT